MAKKKIGRINLLFAAVFFSGALWLVYEDWRMPPSENALSYSHGIVDSVIDQPFRSRYQRQKGERVEMKLRGRSQGFMFLKEQPGFHTVCYLKPGDEVDLKYDPWPLSHSRSFHVYSLSVNGNVVATYEQTVAAQKRGFYTCFAVLPVLLGLGALAAKIKS